jgi:hypothetical protein
VTDQAALPATRWQLGCLVLLSTVLLFVTADLEPLFYSNQNTKFLHGLAQAGYGYLSQDWTANTVDGLPVFSVLVRWTAEIGPFWLFYLEQFLAYALYVWAAFLIFRRSSAWAAAAGMLPLLLFGAVFAMLHYEQSVMGGVAKQLIIKTFLEPATFGGFALLGIAVFLAGRPLLAALLINVAAALHAGYVAPGGFLLLGMAACLPLTPKPERQRLVLAVAVGLALLALDAYLLKLAFPPTSPEAQAAATDLLANKRIPQHTDPLHWMNGESLFKLVLCLAAAALTPNRHIARILVVGVIGILASALLVIVIEANFVRLVSPWRVSVFLVPIAWVALLAWLFERALPWLRSRGRLRPALAVAAAASLAFAALGIAATTDNFGRDDPEYDAMVRAELGPGQVYLTSPEATYFRLRYGAPQYVSEKTHPYLDVEVLEWQRRIEVATALYAGDSFDCEVLAKLRDQEHVTHVLRRKREPTMTCPFAHEIGAKGESRLYRLDGAS